MQPSDEQPTSVAAESEAQISKLAEISREMVRVYKVQFGRGPTKARTEFAGPDLVICTLAAELFYLES